MRSVHLMLHCAFERAVKERLIPRNPTDDCIAPKVRKIEMKILAPEHIKGYLDAADQRGLLPMFYLELVSGLRKGELVALLWSDLDTQNKTISVSKQYIKNPNGELTLSRPKTETSVRRVSIPQTAVDLLSQEHDKHPTNPYMFPSPVTGEMYYPDSVVNLHKKILKDAGLEHIRFHDLRHTFATVSLQNGVDIKTVSSMLGHYDAGFTLAPTPTLQDRSRTRPRKPWAASWNKLCRGKHVKKHRAGSFCFLPGAFETFPALSPCGSRCGSRGKRLTDTLQRKAQAVRPVALIGDAGHFLRERLFPLRRAGPADAVLPTDTEKYLVEPLLLRIPAAVPCRVRGRDIFFVIHGPHLLSAHRK